MSMLVCLAVEQDVFAWNLLTCSHAIAVFLNITQINGSGIKWIANEPKSIMHNAIIKTA